MCLVLGSLEAFTLYVLSKFAERYEASTYSKLTRKALGRKLGACGSPSFPDDPVHTKLARHTSCTASSCRLTLST
jgi:hypothetical protein